ICALFCANCILRRNAALWLKRGTARVNRVISNFTDWFQRAAKRARQGSRDDQRTGSPMIFRAIFWIGLVAVLMPHEPDLGFGRPASLDSNVAGEVAGWAKTELQPNLKDPENLCRYNTDACAAGASMVDN